MNAIENIEPSQSVTLPIPVKTGYVFDGWIKDEQKVGNSIIVEGNVNLTATWKLDENINAEITIRVPSGIISTSLVGLISKFNQTYPNIKVNIDVVVMGYNAVRNSTIRDIQSNNAPNLVIGYPDHFAEYYSGGALVNLESFIQSQSGLSSDDLNDFIKEYLDEGKGFDGENPEDLYTLPFAKSTEVLIYNKTIMDALAQKAPGEVFIPKTWAEVKSVSTKILQMVSSGEADNIIPLGYGERDFSRLLADGNFTPFVYDSPSNAFITIANQWGGAYTERVNALKGSIAFQDDPNVIQGLTYFQNEAISNRFALPSKFGGDYASDAFKSLKTVMFISSSGGMTYCNPEGKFEVGVAQIPYFNENEKDVVLQGVNIGILNQSSVEEQNASWLFLRFLMQPENTASFCMDTNTYFPVRKSAYDLPEFKTLLSSSSPYSMAANVGQSYLDEGFNYIIDSGFFGSAFIREEVKNTFNDIITYKQNIENRLTKAYLTLGKAFYEGQSVIEESDLNILLPSDITNLVSDLLLPQKVYIDDIEYAISWEATTSDYFIIEEIDNFGILKARVTRPQIGFLQQEITLTAKVLIEGIEHTQTWKVYVKPFPSPSTLDIESTKKLPTYSNVQIIGNVVQVSSNGFTVYDGIEGMFIFLDSSNQVEVKPGSIVEVKGTRSLYYSRPMVSDPVIQILLPAPEDGYDYSSVPTVDSTTYLSASSNNTSAYGRLLRVSGIVIKDYKINDKVIASYALKDEVTNNVIIIYNGSSSESQAQLETKVDSKISIVVVTYDYNEMLKVWRSFAIENTIIDIS